MALIRSLRLAILLGLGALVGIILLSLSTSARGGPPRPRVSEPHQIAGAARLAQQASNVEIVRTRKGAPTLRLQALESRSYTDGRLELTRVTFHLFDPSGQETTVESPSATSLPAADEPETSAAGSRRAAFGSSEGLGSWLLKGGVTVSASDGLKLSTPRLIYSEAQGQASTDESVSFNRGPASGTALGMIYEVESQIVRFQGDVTASMPLGGMGLVEVQAASAAHDLRRHSFEMRNYRAITGRSESLSGAQLVASFLAVGGIRRLEADQGFVLETAHAVSAPASSSPSPLSKLLALEGARTMRGRKLAVQFGQDQEPTSIEVSGDALLTAVDALAGGAPSSVAARTFTFDLSEGVLTRARAEGAVDLKGAPAAGESAGFRLLSNHLDAAFDPNLGTLLNMEGQGEIRVSDEGMHSEGSRSLLDPNSDIIVLSGEEGQPATFSWMDRKIQAQIIEADRRRKTLSARAGVRASYRPPARSESHDAAGSQQALPFFKGGETIYAMAGSLSFAEQGKVAHYRDRVRLWQGESRLEASEIDLDESGGTLEARGDVTSTFRQPAPAGRARPLNPSEQIVTVAASTMRYERAANRIVYTGRVLVTQGALRVTADSTIVTLSVDGGSADLMEAVGNVALREPGRTGKADRLIADPRADTLKLIGSGREAIVQDETGQQVVRGTSLTMDRSGDRILVESEAGGRTWITLKPRQKGAPGVGPVPRD